MIWRNYNNYINDYYFCIILAVGKRCKVRRGRVFSIQIFCQQYIYCLMKNYFFILRLFENAFLIQKLSLEVFASYGETVDVITGIVCCNIFFRKSKCQHLVIKKQTSISGSYVVTKVFSNASSPRLYRILLFL